ncbi:hypothetical protein [Nocardia vermiculata]|uniref:Uncharacterized protein n=1 Tax=Nocardia vermiculata TaxID=257274 RepID=A0A846Y406_9NOCA|nr:hypothetical protein [Nocardia vermiculata]NKY53973.1 hypothetical protein [Nocardia vermiculata]
MFETNGEPADAAATARLIKLGYLRADNARRFQDGLKLLVSHLQHEPVPNPAVLAQRIEDYAARPRPYLPRGSRDLGTSETFTAWISPARILLKLPGTRSFIHDNSNAARRRQTGTSRSEYVPANPVAGIAEFAARIAMERGEPAGLAELLGHPDEPAIQVEAWDTPAGPLFRIETNGNHRVAALAALAVPCVLAEVRLHTGLFDTSPTADLDQMDDIDRYRRLLHTFGVAAFSDTGMMGAFAISSRWPILIRDPESAVKSLTSMEQIIGSPITGNIGQIPRSWFASGDELRALSRDLDTSLTRFLAGHSKPRMRRFKWRSPA